MSAFRTGDYIDGPEGHRVHLGRTCLGSRTYGSSGGLLYGATARCGCGWRCQVNIAPSRGGTDRAVAQALLHLAEVGSGPVCTV